MKLGSDVDPKDKVCYNCKHLLWLIGVGAGLRCNLKNPPKLIPHSRHSCEHFKNKKDFEQHS